MTAFSEFYDIIRAILDDTDPDVHVYDEAQLDSAIRAALALRKITSSDSGQEVIYTFSGDSVSPSLTMSSDPTAFAQLAYYSAHRFVSAMKPLSWRTRAFSETVGEAGELIHQLLDDIHKLENGAMVGTTWP
jgi:hypothetical protein